VCTGDTATHCNTLQHTATHCNITLLPCALATLQHTVTQHCCSVHLRHCYTATHCSTLQHTATHCNTTHLRYCVTLQQKTSADTATTHRHTYSKLGHSRGAWGWLQHCNTTHCSTHNSAIDCNIPHACNTLQRSRTHCNNTMENVPIAHLQHTRTHCNNTPTHLPIVRRRNGCLGLMTHRSSAVNKQIDSVRDYLMRREDTRVVSHTQHFSINDDTHKLSCQP